MAGTYFIFLRMGVSQYSHFTAGKTEAQRGKGTCLQTHIWKMAALGLNISHLCSLAGNPALRPSDSSQVTQAGPGQGQGQGQGPL